LRRWNPSPDEANAAEATVAIARLVEELQPDAMLLWAGAERVTFAGRNRPVVVADRVDAMTLAAWREIREPGATLRRHHLTTLASFAAYERRVVRASFATVVVGEDDAGILRRLSGRASVHIIGNGVDSAVHAEPRRDGSRPTVMFTGVMDFPPNVDAAAHFARDVWPGVRARRPDSRFVIVGRHPLPAITALHGINGVEVWPDVPSVREALRDAWVVVAPMRTGTGVKNKILEAWAAGRPVVMSAIAANGLVPTPANASLIVDDAAAMAQRVVSLLDAPGECLLLGSTLQRHAAQHHRWEPLGERLSQLLAGVAEPRCRVTPQPIDSVICAR
jgi:glycosyltransferase involved in cell wall biosynthesis